MDNVEQLKNLVDDLFWEYDRMSSCGQETLNKIADLIDLKSIDEE